MAITVRPAVKEDREEIIRIEHETMPNHTYYIETEKELMDPEQGVMLLALEDGVPTGIAHLYFQPDNAGWFEILRVTPSSQKHGAGTALWDEALAICEAQKLKSLAMYTGKTNITSKKIAERKGLSLVSSVVEGTFPKEELKFIPENTAILSEFKPVDEAEAYALCSEADTDFRGYFVFNRTFYAFTEENAKWLAAEKMLYTDGETVISIGCRFNKDSQLQIGFVSGDAEKAISFATEMLRKTGLPKLVIDIPEGSALVKKFEAQGFGFGESIIISLKRTF